MDGQRCSLSLGLNPWFGRLELLLQRSGVNRSTGKDARRQQSATGPDTE